LRPAASCTVPAGRSISPPLTSRWNCRWRVHCWIRVAVFAFCSAALADGDSPLNGFQGTQESSEIGALGVPHCTTPSLFKKEGPTPAASRLPLGEPVELDVKV